MTRRIPLLNSEGNILELFLSDNCEIFMNCEMSNIGWSNNYTKYRFRPNKHALVRFLKGICPLSHLIEKSEPIGLKNRDQEIVNIPSNFDVNWISCFNYRIGTNSSLECAKEIKRLKLFLEFMFDKKDWFK